MGVVSAGGGRRLEEQNAIAQGIPPATPSGGPTTSPAQISDDHQVSGQKLQVRSQTEQAVDDSIELDQDARRNAVHVLGQARMPLPQQHSIATQRMADRAAAESQRQALSKTPVTHSGLPSGQSGRNRPQVRRTQRKLLGGAPEQKIPFRPQGNLQGSVTIC